MFLYIGQVLREKVAPTQTERLTTERYQSTELSQASESTIRSGNFLWPVYDENYQGAFCKTCKRD